MVDAITEQNPHEQAAKLARVFGAYAKIAKDIVDPEDVEMLQDLVLSAVQQVQKKVKDTQAAEMGKLTGGLGLPPGMGF